MEVNQLLLEYNRLLSLLMDLYAVTKTRSLLHCLDVVSGIIKSCRNKTINHRGLVLMVYQEWGLSCIRFFTVMVLQYSLVAWMGNDTGSFDAFEQVGFKIFVGVTASVMN
ncbi:uncharacterized protein LOC131230638 [Magnolia sinica]|uniref:uncharacterized protein LOC131230638 n=1 Tax=Magnolia sinica TaxID=86752 RepID=UPI0026592060|nr:uncharacterized protein LOC131230638 [Magnolia sinica]